MIWTSLLSELFPLQWFGHSIPARGVLTVMSNGLSDLDKVVFLLHIHTGISTDKFTHG